MADFERVGLLRCVREHMAFGRKFYNAIPLKDNEDLGSKIKFECGLCFKRQEGKVEKIDLRYKGK